jgi:ribosomal protein S18 acetylase RimI-like enzyme
MTISAIASEVGQSHVSVVQIINEMVRKGFVSTRKDKSDKRKTLIYLTAKGKEADRNIQSQYADVNHVVQEMLAETEHNLWVAIGEWEERLANRSLADRVRERRKQREQANVEIVDYQPRFKKAFQELNVRWISTYFKMEKADHETLDNPNQYIIKKGGFIFIALYNGDPVGTCALLPMDGHSFELVKMAVHPDAQGKNIGWLLGRACIAKAKSEGAKKLFLESNTILVPAINLYRKLGFREVAKRPSPYERCNIQMELDIASA